MGSRWHPSYCRVCGTPATELEPISAQGYCLEHGLQRMNENNVQLAEHRGPWFEHWRRRSLAALGVRLIDDGAATE